eukprot:5013622-Pleurochrysis_carterae.AAC.2
MVDDENGDGLSKAAVPELVVISSIESLLRVCGFEHLGAILQGETIRGLVEALDNRPALLAALKAKGVAKLGERQLCIAATVSLYGWDTRSKGEKSAMKLTPAFSHICSIQHAIHGALKSCNQR